MTSKTLNAAHTGGAANPKKGVASATTKTKPDTSEKVPVIEDRPPKKPPAPKRDSAGASQPASEKATKKIKRPKVVRDSFTMPEEDYAKIATLKQKCLAVGVSVKKSELLRAGLNVLESLSTQKLKAVVGALESVKTGRPTADSPQKEGDSRRRKRS